MADSAGLCRAASAVFTAPCWVMLTARQLTAATVPAPCSSVIHAGTGLLRLEKTATGGAPAPEVRRQGCRVHSSSAQVAGASLVVETAAPRTVRTKPPLLQTFVRLRTRCSWVSKPSSFPWGDQSHSPKERLRTRRRRRVFPRLSVGSRRRPYRCLALDVYACEALRMRWHTGRVMSGLELLVVEMHRTRCVSASPSPPGCSRRVARLGSPAMVRTVSPVRMTILHARARPSLRPTSHAPVTATVVAL